MIILIGRDCAEAMGTRCLTEKSPWVHHTALGYALVGRVCEQSGMHSNDRKVLRTSISHEHYNVKTNLSLNEKVENDLLENNVFHEFRDDNENGLSVEDKKFLSIMNDNISVDAENSLVVPLPFKNERKLPNNKKEVYYRSKNCFDRLKLQNDKLAQCVEIMNKCLKSNYVEKVPRNESNPKDGFAWWIPMFPVTHPRKNKTRLVYDASASYYGTSLNQKLLKGPDSNNQLRGVLLRFRQGQIGFVADIEAMFNRFKVTDECKNYLRFFWFDNNDPGKPIVEYRSRSHIFGCTSSPAVANFCLKYTVRNESNSNPAKKYIEHSFYVDDGLGSANSVEEAITILKSSIDVLSRYSVRLHKILSSSPDVLAAFPEAERAEGCYDLKYEEIPTQRTLGVLWDAQQDEFFMEVVVPSREFTKRGILSVINSLYDPLGFVSPVVLGGHLFRRKIMPP